MMYNEFLELSGKSESYISYKEYTEEIEPIYMACDLPTKEDFIKAFNETFERIVYPIVENTISNFSTEEKLAYLYSFRREEMDESVRMFDRRERKMIYHKAEGRCQLCGCKITYDEMSLDHIVPLAMGGEDSLENLQATCEPCNSHKKALLPEAYFDKVNRTFVFQMNKKYSHNLLWKLSKLFIGRLEKQA